MALTDEGGMGTTMLVSPTNGGFGGFGGDWSSWIILFLIFGMFGGWSNGFGGGYGMDNLYPWMNNSQNINDGFRDQMLNSSINAIQPAIVAGQNALSQQMYTNQIADMERSFNAQTANTAGLTNLSAQLAQCCCDNRQATSDLRYTVATEACADRQAVNDALRDVLTANTASTQRILDQLCADKIDAKNERIAELQNQLTMAQLAASQNAQTAQIIANNEAQTGILERYLAPNPIPAYVVSNPNGCGCNTGCGNF